MTPAFVDLIDLAAERFGGAVVAANDEFFAPKERLIAPEAPVWREGEYTERGKWTDGWETRRRRDPGNDWCVVRFGAPGLLRGVDVETTHFKGNFPEACGIDTADLVGQPVVTDFDSLAWHEALPRQLLAGHSHNFFPIER